ncbi:MAG: cobalamin B12-binding domain-containing protein [Planctomycetota bacterium]
MDTEGGELLSIGQLAERAGLSPDTIRVWERRYGRPASIRLPSGHRRYRPEQAEWLRRVHEAIAQGSRTAEAVQATPDELERMLAGARPGERARDPAFEDRVLAAVAAYDREGLVRELRHTARAIGLRALVHDRVAPLLWRIGRDWSEGRIDVRHEHLASEVLEDLLRAQRLRLPPGDGPTLLFTTLEGEGHSLGMQMAATLAALAGYRALVIGTGTPLDDLVAAAAESGCVAVCLSVSSSSGGPASDRVLAELAARLPSDVALVVGGRGAVSHRRRTPGVTVLEELGEFEDWLAANRRG